MGFVTETNISAITVFLQGLLSFFSPCVLPLIPLYMGYLSGGMQTTAEDGTSHYQRKTIMVNTLFFVIGISCAFFLLGMGMSAVGYLFKSNRMLFSRVGGIFVVFMGLSGLGVFQTFKIMGKERRLPFELNVLIVKPLSALLLGFLFSFAWTPCVGPALASVLLMAASASTTAVGFVLVGIYSLGFVLPFLALGLFTRPLLDWLSKHKGMVKYTAKTGSVLMILMGIMMITGWMNSITGYLSKFGAADPVSKTKQESEESLSKEQETPEEQTKSQDQSTMSAIDFTLKDQFGIEHSLSQYRGKTVLLNFWATWCPPCREEMPDIQQLYERYGKNEGDLIVLGVAGPNMGGEKSKEEIAAFLEENGYSYPVVMDESGDLFTKYGITAYPTTFMITKSGEIFGYVPGMLTKDMMENIVQQTMGESK